MRLNKSSCWSLLLVTAILGHSAPASGCTLFPPFRQLPGEAADAYKLRSSSLLAAQYDEERRSWQVHHYDRADRVFIARVLEVSSNPADGGQGQTLLVDPLRAVKGTLPTQRMSVQDMRYLSCQGIVGGVRRSARVGDYTIIFESAQGSKEVAIHEARDPRLIAAIGSFRGE